MNIKTILMVALAEVLLIAGLCFASFQWGQSSVKIPPNVIPYGPFAVIMPGQTYTINRTVLEADTTLLNEYNKTFWQLMGSISDVDSLRTLLHQYTAPVRMPETTLVAKQDSFIVHSTVSIGYQPILRSWSIGWQPTVLFTPPKINLWPEPQPTRPEYIQVIGELLSFGAGVAVSEKNYKLGVGLATGAAASHLFKWR